MRFFWISPEASQYLDEIFDYFANHNVGAGERFVIAFENKCEKLLQFPNMGKSYQDIESSLRGIPLDNYSNPIWFVTKIPLLFKKQGTGNRG